MKIDVAPLPTPEKDVGSRSSRADPRDADAGQAFGAAVKTAGDKAMGRKSEPATVDHEAPKGTAEDDSKATDRDGKDTGAATVNQPAAVDLLALMSAIVRAEPAAEGTAADDPKTGRETRSSAKAEAVQENEETASRLPRVQVLKAETHFEPRMEGAVTQAPKTAGAHSGQDEGQNAAAEMALRLEAPQATGRAARPVAAPPPVSDSGAVGTRAEAVPVRFDEALARLAQGQSATGDDTGSGARGEGRDGARRTLAERGETTSSGTRVEVSTAKSAADAPAADKSGSVPGLVLQVASRIADALGSAPAASGSASRNNTSGTDETAHLRMRAGGAALKTLTIQLQPEHLGTLEVSMRLREGKLAIELTASKPEAAAALTQDRETLRKVLETAGFALDDAALTVTTREATVVRSGDAANSNASTGGNPSGSPFSGSASNGREEARQRGAPADRSEASNGDGSPRGRSVEDVSRARAAGQTYL